MATQVTDQEIKSFVRKVQNHLVGLNTEDQRELTENLEADLLDRREEEGSSFKLGDAKTYASDLADAAGLDLESVEVSRLNIEFLKLWKATLAYFRTLSPAWAIVRGWLMFALIYTPILYGSVGEVPGGVRDTLVLISLIAINIWLGRKQFLALKYPLVILNVVLLAGSSLVIADISNAYNLYAKYAIFENTGSLTFQGHPVRAFCAIGTDGSKIYDVKKLVDQDGYQVFISEEPEVPTVSNCF
ncbi:MAG: hypothetical protein RLZZ56_106 [Actinomycetota bacterium]|jgi:hypothetical protein